MAKFPKTPKEFTHDPELTNPPDIDEKPGDREVEEVAAEPVDEEMLLANMDASGFQAGPDEFNLLRVFMRLIRQKPGQQPTYTRLANSIGKSREWVLARMTNPSFMAWFNNAQEYVRQSQLAGVHEAMIAKAVGGDMRATKLTMERFDPGYNAGSRRGQSAIENNNQAGMQMEQVMNLIQQKTGASMEMVRLLLSGKAQIVPIGKA